MYFLKSFAKCLNLLILVACGSSLTRIPDDYLALLRLDQMNDEAAGDYNYDQQGTDWNGTCRTGQKQTPIDLVYDEAIATSIPRLRFYNYDQALRTPLVLKNTGKTVNMVLPVTRNGQRAYINGGMLPGNFEAQSVHFHWGSANSSGSEHAIDSVFYDMEMHIVHKNTKYPTVAAASERPDGLAVLGVMFHGVPRAFSQHYGLSKIFNQLPRIIPYNSNATITGQLTVGQLLGNIITGEFFTYNGSLTTPNCAESVTWTVFSDAVEIPQRQLVHFWTLMESRNRPLINNFRNLQNLNGRPVYYRRF